MDGPVIVEVAVEVPGAAVWRALHDPHELGRRHGWDFAEGGGLDGEIREIYFGGARADAGRLSLDTGAAFVLEPRGATTIVRVTRAAPEGHDDWRGLYEEINGAG